MIVFINFFAITLFLLFRLYVIIESTLSFCELLETQCSCRFPINKVKAQQDLF